MLGVDDDSWHTLFVCGTWKRDREEIFRSVVEIGEGELNPGSLIPIMLRSEESWNRVSVFKMEME